jgi:hypothetical protein
LANLIFIKLQELKKLLCGRMMGLEVFVSCWIRRLLFGRRNRLPKPLLQLSALNVSLERWVMVFVSC